MAGKGYLVGAGPGRADLITVRGLTVMHNADLVIYDRLISAELLREAPAHAELVFAGKRPGTHVMPQHAITAMLVEAVRAGKQVVRLKGGDPMVFAHGGEEALALAEANLPYEIVPGVSSVLAVPSYAGIPLTMRGVPAAFTVISGHEVDPLSPTWQHAAHAPMLVVLMATARVPEVCSALIAAGRASIVPVAIVSRGTTRQQQILVGTLETLPELARGASLPTPAMLVIGETVAHAERLRWFDPEETGSTFIPVDD